MIDIKDLVEVTLDDKDDFLKVRETLTRIGPQFRGRHVRGRGLRLRPRPEVPPAV